MFVACRVHFHVLLGFSRTRHWGCTGWYLGWCEQTQCSKSKNTLGPPKGTFQSSKSHSAKEPRASTQGLAAVFERVWPLECVQMHPGSFLNRENNEARHHSIFITHRRPFVATHAKIKPSEFEMDVGLTNIIIHDTMRIRVHCNNSYVFHDTMVVIC